MQPADEVNDQQGIEDERVEAPEDEEIAIEALEEPVQDDSPEKTTQPALVINVHSWATPIIGIVMLVVGALGGYFLRPLISPDPSEPVSVAQAAPTPIAQAADANSGSTADQTNETASSVDREEMMSFLIAQVKHFKGDPEAPVTIIEFSDFQ